MIKQIRNSYFMIKQQYFMIKQLPNLHTLSIIIIICIYLIFFSHL